jgi:hypothetical protein
MGKIADEGMRRLAMIEEKIKRYRAFWSKEPVERPMIGFSLGGWFQLKNYSALEKLRGRPRIEADQLSPEDFFPDYDRIVNQWNIEDDLIRAVAPIPPFPWLEAMLGCSVQIGKESVWVDEGGFEYAHLGRIDFSPRNPWRLKYLEFLAALKNRYGERYPVGQPILRGVSDLIAALRGASRMVLDLYDHPGDFDRLAYLCGTLIIELVREQQVISGSLADGYIVEQLSLWAPGPILRMQEDASALFSPDLYSQRLQEEDERQALSFPFSVIHLHTSSLFLLDRILRIDPLKCIQINKDAGDVSISEMLPFLKMVQPRGKTLLIRGKLDREDLKILRQELSPRGLYLQIVVETPDEITSLRDVFDPWV